MTSPLCILVLSATIMVAVGQWESVNWHQWPITRQPTGRNPGGYRPPPPAPKSWYRPVRVPPRRPRPGPGPAGGQNNDYCHIESCQANQHTVCRYPARPSAACGEVESVKMTAAEIKEVVDKHNELRAKVARGEEPRGRPGPQPAATNLGPLKWNDELAKIAQTWANQCISQHDDCRNTAQGRVGQNIGFKGSSEGYTVTVSDLVTDWYDEVANFNPQDVRTYLGRNPFTGHYSQMVWAETKEIGCGLIRFKHAVTSKGFYRTQLVCNYAPMGNIRKFPIYSTR